LVNKGGVTGKKNMGSFGKRVPLDHKVPGSYRWRTEGMDKDPKIYGSRGQKKCPAENGGKGQPQASAYEKVGRRKGGIVEENHRGSIGNHHKQKKKVEIETARRKERKKKLLPKSAGRAVKNAGGTD